MNRQNNVFVLPCDTCLFDFKFQHVSTPRFVTEICRVCPTFDILCRDNMWHLSWQRRWKIFEASKARATRGLPVSSGLGRWAPRKHVAWPTTRHDDTNSDRMILGLSETSRTLGLIMTLLNSIWAWMWKQLWQGSAGIRRDSMESFNLNESWCIRTVVALWICPPCESIRIHAPRWAATRAAMWGSWNLATASSRSSRPGHWQSYHKLRMTRTKRSLSEVIDIFKSRI